MNVLQLISSGGYYGAENVVISLSESLENNNCRSVIGIFQNDAQRNEEFIRQAARRSLATEQINCRGRLDRQAVGTIQELLERLNIDILHTHGYKADIYGFLSSRKRKVPIVSTCHLWTRDTTAVRFYDYVDSLVLRRFSGVVAVSESIAESLVQSGIRESEIRVIDNGIDLHSFSEASTSVSASFDDRHRLVVGAVGRLVPQKGLEYFLSAAREVLLSFPDVIFKLIGSGPERKKLEQMARDLGIAQNVIFVGECTDMPRAYASMDVFVLSSVDEGMPMVVLEALASKKAVIATRVGAVPKLVIHEKTGLLIAPRDVPALKEAILRLLNDAFLRSELGKNGEALVTQHHSRDSMAQNYLQLYEEVGGRSHESVCQENSDPKDIVEAR